jgi:hypothetical protein
VPLQRREGYRLWVGGPVPPGSAATTVGRTIVVRRGLEDDALLLRHELVHVEQYRRLGILPFLVGYLGAYVGLRLRGYPHLAAYRRIPFEIEAEWFARRPGVTERTFTARDRSAPAGLD